jgi:hypothetical protein
MTEESARRYDTQVEVLFNGTANATRRQALPQLRGCVVSLYAGGNGPPCLGATDHHYTH